MFINNLRPEQSESQTSSLKGKNFDKDTCKTLALNAARSACCLTFTDSDGDDCYESSGNDTQKNCENSETIDAELGLIEDHFSCPEGCFGFSTSEELEMAIDNCKEIIMATPEKTDKRKQLVMKLVQLRLQLQEIKEGPPKLPDLISVVLGHHFQLHSMERPQQYCEKCCKIIWGVIQGWYCCEKCGFKCHNKCLNLITRVCASSKVSENPSYILDLCPEVGLSQQNYRCAECKRRIIFSDSNRLPRQCDYNGLYYCSYCHWNSQSIIPARVTHNWDFTPRKVCRASLQFLRIMAKKPVLNIESLNPALFGFTELSTVKKFREDILMMKQYFLTCHTALEAKLLLQLQERQHFVENADTYCLQDLIDLVSGQLMNYLKSIHYIFVKHITQDCQGCRGKGFICELCKSDEIIFPFDSQTNTCPQCYSVFHQECHVQWEEHCPKCARRGKGGVDYK